jgi:hypothetical protein
MQVAFYATLQFLDNQNRHLPDGLAPTLNASENFHLLTIFFLIDSRIYLIAYKLFSFLCVKVKFAIHQLLPMCYLFCFN